MKKLVKCVKNPRKVVNAFLLKFPSLGRLVPDKAYLKIRYGAIFGKKLDLDSPRTFDEKLQWLKLYNRDPLYTTLVDKFAVKKWVADKIGEQYVIPTLGVWSQFEDIDFEKLPSQFVLKCTHDSGGLVIVKDKSTLDIAVARKKITDSLNRNFYWQSREFPYKSVSPRIIAEPYMEDSTYKELRDYKFYTFNGKPRFLLIAKGRQGNKKTFDYFDMDFNHVDLQDECVPNSLKIPEKPVCFEEMKKMSEILSDGIPHVRVDFYEINGKVFFGEMTFFDDGGFMRAKPISWEKEWGDLIELPRCRCER